MMSDEIRGSEHAHESALSRWENEGGAPQSAWLGDRRYRLKATRERPVRQIQTSVVVSSENIGIADWYALARAI